MKTLIKRLLNLEIDFEGHTPETAVKKLSSVIPSKFNTPFTIRNKYNRGLVETGDGNIRLLILFQEEGNDIQFLHIEVIPQDFNQKTPPHFMFRFLIENNKFRGLRHLLKAVEAINLGISPPDKDSWPTLIK